MSEDVNKAETAGRGGRYRYVVLAMLILAYTFNFLDRQILGILAGSIKAELHLTDTQLGLMGGVAFAALYTTYQLFNGLGLIACGRVFAGKFKIHGSISGFKLQIPTPNCQYPFEIRNSPHEISCSRFPRTSQPAHGAFPNHF